MTCPSSSHQTTYCTRPGFSFETSRVTRRSRKGSASGPVMRCFVIGLRSNTEHALRTAKYSSSTLKYWFAVV